MEPERIKELLRLTGETMAKAKSFSAFEAAESQYKALKNAWNRKTGNELIFLDFKNLTLDKSKV